MRTGSILEKAWLDAKALLKHVETLGGFMKETGTGRFFFTDFEGATIIILGW